MDQNCLAYKNEGGVVGLGGFIYGEQSARMFLKRMLLSVLSTFWICTMLCLLFLPSFASSQFCFSLTLPLIEPRASHIQGKCSATESLAIVTSSLSYSHVAHLSQP